jgi:hypothetical protein
MLLNVLFWPYNPEDANHKVAIPWQERKLAQNRAA